MLTELRVENLLLIERAVLRPAAGLNVLTGETGAGKTVLAQALDLLLGGKPRAGVVRPGAREAYVEGSFELTGAARAVAGERLPEDAEELVLARRLSAEGRTRAYLNGRSLPVGELRDVAGALISFYGQHEHRKLMLASAQLEILDAYCGPAQRDLRTAYGAAYARGRDAERELAALRELAGARERELDLLAFELDEIERIGPRAGEEDELLAERARLRAAADLRSAAIAGAEAIAPDSGGDGVAARLAAAAAGLEAVTSADAELAPLAERLSALAYEADDLAGELRNYEQGVESAPGRLEEVEDRTAELERLKRKHGGTLEAVLDHAERCRARRDELAGAEDALERVTAEAREAETELAAHADALSRARAEAAPGLAASVRERLGELAMEGAQFEVVLSPRDARGPTGGDAVELMIAPNPGVPAGPLREVASGGELSRVMVALMSVAAEQDAGDAAAGDGGLLVFDEVDAGIGGHTARAVGERLRALAATRQVLCITHLPQVASLAERHFRVTKDAGAGTALTEVSELAGGDLEAELMRMLGADDDDGAARRHARELLKAA